MEEIWKVITGYEGLYDVSNYGRVRSYRRTKGHLFKILKHGVNKTGYCFVILRKNKHSEYIFIHRLVAIAFIDNPQNKPFVNHKDFNTKNNLYNNLEWVTSHENSLYSANNGRMKTWNRLKGEQSGRHKLTWLQVDEIRRILENKNRLSYGKIGAMFGVSAAAISLIDRNINWLR